MSPGRLETVLVVGQNVLPVALDPTNLNSLSGFVSFTAVSTTEANARLSANEVDREHAGHKNAGNVERLQLILSHP